MAWKLSTALLASLMFVSVASAHTGHTNWGPWQFDWEVKDGAGLAIRNVFYKNELVFYKASMPVIRVKYLKDQADGGCGPYADRITWDSLLEISNCGNAKVCQQSFASGGHNWLKIGVLAGIGSYRLNQVWFLSEDGLLQARLSSKGLQCNIDHTHHVYWRLDFDVNGAPADQVFVFDNNRPSEGWGPGWHKYTNELNDTKNSATGRIWFVRDDPTSHGLSIQPLADDGTADAFSNKDAAPRLYHFAEDVGWPFGASGHLGYDNGEGIQERDVVFWYVAHLHHEAASGGDEWHRAGPFLRIFR